jgi:hypothetical protein
LVQADLGQIGQVQADVGTGPRRARSHRRFDQQRRGVPTRPLPRDDRA